MLTRVLRGGYSRELPALIALRPDERANRRPGGLTETAVGIFGAAPTHVHPARHDGLARQDRAVPGLGVADDHGLQPMDRPPSPDVLRVQHARPDLVVPAGDSDQARNALNRDDGRGGRLRGNGPRLEVQGPEGRRIALGPP